MGRSDEAAALVEEAAALSDVHSAHRGAPAAGAAVSARQLWLSFSSEATRLTHWSSVAPQERPGQFRWQTPSGQTAQAE